MVTRKTWACLPITSLAYICRPEQDLLLSGQGPNIKVESVDSKEVLVQKQVFEFQSIHGIKVQDAWTHLSKGASALLLIWGGQRIALGKVNLPHGGLPGQHLPSSLIVGPEFESTDWILDASFAVAKLPLALAYYVTAHNDVFALQQISLLDFSLNAWKLASGLSSMLYSAHIKPISTSTIVVAAGTAFGEVVVWSCNHHNHATAEVEAPWRSSTFSVCRGHNGSIFGVCLSEVVTLSGHPRRLLASCSDDRTIRIWDISDCDESREPVEDVSCDHHGCVRGAGPRSIVDSCIATTWGHKSRIWGVKFVQFNAGSSAFPLYLISRGEDATCQLWQLGYENPTASNNGVDLSRGHWRLSHVNDDLYHSGKHIWSVSHHCASFGSVIHTGGSDGGIIARSVNTRNGAGTVLSIQTPFHELLTGTNLDLAKDASINNQSHELVKQYIFALGNVLLITTSEGHLLEGTINLNEQSPSQPLTATWNLRSSDTDLQGLPMLTSDPTEGVVYIGNATGNIWMYHHALRSIRLVAKLDHKISHIFPGISSAREDGSVVRHLLVFSTAPSMAKLLELVLPNRDIGSLPALRIVELTLPPVFQPTAFLEMTDGRLFVLGARSGAIAAYYNLLHQDDVEHRIAPPLCLHHIHGSDTVTHLQQVQPVHGSEQDSHDYEFLSTGRDGSYAVHRITFQSHEFKSHSPPILSTLHRSYPPFGPNIEGATVVRTHSGDMHLLLHGFGGKRFMVWNETTNSEVMSVPCGGAHRSWAYFSDNLSSLSRVANQGGCFVWTKARVLNIAKYKTPAHIILQPGGHGREIKALALYEQTTSRKVFVGSCRWLLATGAEDTSIRLWGVTKSRVQTHCNRHNAIRRDSVLCIRTLKKHTAGVQHLCFCNEFLFSSAGCEELFIWKINFGVSTVGVGTVFQAALPKHAEASDLRITSFEVSCVSDRQETVPISKIQVFLIHAAYSNSMVRVFKYTDDLILSPKDRFQLLGEGLYNTTCLTQIHILRASSPWFLTASTNGAVGIWSGIDPHTIARDSSFKLSLKTDHHIHQNAILSLHATRVRPGYHLLLTGGDDNALGITVLHVNDSKSILAEQPGYRNNIPSPRLGTLLIPRAHAAAITAIEVLESRESDCLAILKVLSTGNDQRVKTWRVAVNLNELSRIDQGSVSREHASGPALAHSIEVELLEEIWTSVADASSMVVIPRVDRSDSAEGVDVAQDKSDKGRRVMIAGVGMEMMSIGSEDENHDGLDARTDIERTDRPSQQTSK